MKLAQQKYEISQANILTIYYEIEQVFQKQMNNLKSLIDKFNTLLERDQQLIYKASNRILKSLKVGFTFHEQQSLKQKPFDEEDYRKIQNEIKYQYNDEKLSIQAIAFIKEMEINSELQSLEVDQKSEQFLKLISPSKRFVYYYYGYLLKGQPTGRGVFLNTLFIVDGYFINGECIIGQEIECSIKNLMCIKLNPQYINYRKMPKITPLEILPMIVSLDRDLQQTIITEKFLIVVNELNERSDISDKGAEYIIKDYYRGYMLNGVRHGIGGFYNQQNRVFGWGLWKGDLLRYGILIKKEKNSVIDKYGDIDDDLQQYLF